MAIPAIPLILLNLITGAISQAAADPTVPIAPRNADVVAREVVTRVEQDPRFQQVTAQIQHATNTEPWYQSRVTWGAIIAMGSGVAALAGVTLTGEDQVALMNIGVAAGAAIGGAVTLYGRWRARKPLGA